MLVPVRDYNTLTHLDRAVTDTDTEQRDVIVMTIRLLAGPDAGVSDIEKEELFTDYEQILFTKVVSIAERHGRAVKLLVVAGDERLRRRWRNRRRRRLKAREDHAG